MATPCERERVANNSKVIVPSVTGLAHAEAPVKKFFFRSRGGQPTSRRVVCRRLAALLRVYWHRVHANDPQLPTAWVSVENLLNRCRLDRL